jgi:hypothetical protein
VAAKTYDLHPWAKVTASMLPEYGQWSAMVNRCCNPNNLKWKNYQGATEKRMDGGRRPKNTPATRWKT